MSTCTNYFDFYDCDLAHYRTFLAPKFSQRSCWPLMTSVDFIHTLKTSFLNHQLGSWIGSFFGGLEKQSYSFIFRNFVDLAHENRDQANQASHVSIMATHVCCTMMFGFMLEIWIGLNHCEGIHVGSKGNASVLALFGCLTHQINNKSSFGHLLPCWGLHSKLLQNVFDPLSGLIFFEGFFGVSMELTSEFDKALKSFLWQHEVNILRN